MPLVVETLGPCFLDFFFLPAIGTRGVILLAWNCNEVAISSPYVGQHHITTLVSSTSGAHPWWIISVYSPQEDDEKILFLEDLQDTCASCAGPWLLGGDFSLVSSSVDKTNGRINRRTSNRFRRFIVDMELRDVYMHGRRYSWSNERESPTLLRNDRFLCTSEWELAQPHSIL